MADNRGVHEVINSDTTAGSHHADHSDWKAVSFTHVEYHKGDSLGFLLAWCSLVPFCLIVSFITLIAFRRDLHTISYFMGILLNEGTNWILKHIIQEQRPLRGRINLFTEYGMPSSHSQFMWFFATYMVFFIAVRVHRNYNLFDDLWKVAVCGASFIASVFVSYSSTVWSLTFIESPKWEPPSAPSKHFSFKKGIDACLMETGEDIIVPDLIGNAPNGERVYLEYHTFGQVLCGSILGIFNGALWFAVVQFIFTPYFPLLASCPLGEILMLRDSTLIPHVLWFEYTSSRSEARNRQRKVTSRKSQ